MHGASKWPSPTNTTWAVSCPPLLEEHPPRASGLCLSGTPQVLKLHRPPLSGMIPRGPAGSGLGRGPEVGTRAPRTLTPMAAPGLRLAPHRLRPLLAVPGPRLASHRKRPLPALREPSATLPPAQRRGGRRSRGGGAEWALQTFRISGHCTSCTILYD